MTHSVSIRDIAAAAGVSHTTVSRALHNSRLISPQVREHIQLLAQEMGYIPNAVAQSLKNKRTKSIGVVVTAIADPFLSRVVRGIEDVAQRAGFSVLLSTTYNDPEREASVVETFHQRRVDGIIVASSRYGVDSTSRLAQVNVPVVLINREADSDFAQLYSVSVDDYQGACAMVQYLLDAGHCSIAYLGADSRPRSNRLRMQGYQDAMRAAGIEPCPEWIQVAPPEHRYHSDDVEDGRAMLAATLTAGMTAVFCYNDMIAIGFMLGCREAGIPIPERMSVAGFDDIELAQYVNPPLTTVHQPKLRLGEIAMEMLLNLMAGKQAEASVMLPTELVVRASADSPP
ncbi:MAG TPA: LacI family DNA-binding transcriptional regulator [Levilinea sp.]|nr:LacI family DNA-binding transcriptional regulator [Levilinea sp.]